MINLSSDQLDVVIDSRRGADILSATDRPTGVDVLFTTPWAERAEAIRSGQMAPSSADPLAGPLEQYAGGWNVLCPNAGGARDIAGGPVAFHGEAWVVPWSVGEATETRATLYATLFSVPVAIDRSITLDGGTITVVDALTNLSSVPIDVDYVSHPAFSTAFLDGKCTIATGARRFNADPGYVCDVTPGTTHEWPSVTESDGSVFDLSTVPAPGTSHTLFGWLSDFTEHRAAITNHDLGLTVTLAWDGSRLPYAWLWQELNASTGFPWFQRARVMAIEPSSTPTGGPGRVPSLRLEASATVTIQTSLVVTRHL